MFKKFFVTVCLALALLCGSAYGESVTLGWDANTDNIDGYVVYRSAVSGSGYAEMDTIPCTAGDSVCCEYIGEELPWNTTFYWVVTAFKGVGATYSESGFSNEVNYTTSTEPIIPPNTPTGCFIKQISK